MKKQFFRVKQLADQTFSRSGKTEALSDDLQAADKKIEFIKLACSNISRRLSTSLLAIGQDAQAKDKRLRKCTDYLLSLTFLESSNTEEDSLLRYILLECSKIQMCLANAFADYDARVENNIVIPLNQIVDVDVPNVMKQKRNLTKLILDMDSARNRYHTALKHNLSTGSGTNMAKIDSIKDELEDIEFKVEQCRDALASDMFQIISKESEIADLLLQYIKHQRAYHKTALMLLDEMVPEIEAHISNSNTRKVFGIPLEEHLRITQRKIAYPIELCICTLLELGMEEEGLFRVAGGASKVRRMKLSFDANCMTLESAMEYRDIHVISSVLKCYLRELPEPLLTCKLYNEWMAAIRCTGNESDKLAAILNVVKKLPEGNFDNLRYVIKFLNILTKNQDVNKMTSQNLAIVIAPNLIWSPDNNSKNMGLNMNVASQHNVIVECLVSHADHFFPDDEMFYISLEITKKCHTRSNSADIQLISTNTCTSEPTTPVRRTQSSDSLVEEPSSVINVFHESPKPVTRTRKNKPAPVPPVQNTITANKSSTDLTKLELHFSDSIKTVVDKENVTDTISVPYNEPQIDMTNVAHENNNKCLKLTCIKYDLNDDNKSIINVNKPEQMQQSESKPVVQNKYPTGQNVVANTCSNFNSSLPSPRQVNASTDVLLNEEVVLRKPTIPERPASLQRPFSSSFRKLADLLDSGSVIDKQENHRKKGPSLERTHLYSVDKQQVKIHVKNAVDEEVPVVISCTDNASAVSKLPNQFYDKCDEHGSPATTDNVDSDKKSIISSECEKSKLSGKIESPTSEINIIPAQQPPATENKIQSAFSGDTEKKEAVKAAEKKPERPPKPESICVRSNSNVHSSSHTRALSDGHNIDIYGTVPGPHHRAHYKIQRPLPPPPPPPILPDKQRSSSAVDSTNL